MVVSPPLDRGEDLHLLTQWGNERDRGRFRKAALISVGLHFLVIITMVAMPEDFFGTPRRPQQAVARKITPLVAPLYEPTQTTPNKGKVSKEFDADTVLPRPHLRIPPAAPSTTRPAAVKPDTPLVRPAPEPTLTEPPKIAPPERNTAVAPPIEVARAAPPPQIQAQEKPKLAFENPATALPGPPGGTGTVAAPNTSIREAIRNSVRSGGSGGLTVGDVGEPGIGGIGEGVNLPPSPGRQGSNLELLSDPMGVDFRPYLTMILANVRRNWFAVMPESAKLGRRGKVVIQFAIARNGSVPKLVIVNQSGTDALDRAAVAGVSASNPFPALPTEFKGDQIRLQFNFQYNMPVR